MAEFDNEESHSRKDISDDLYYANVGKKPRLFPPVCAVGFAYCSIVDVTFKANPLKKIFTPFRIGTMAAAGTIGYAFAVMCEKIYYRRFKKKLLVIEDYIKLHPEQFVEQEPKRYKDIVLPWIPYR